VGIQQKELLKMRSIRQLAIGLAALGSTALAGSLAVPAVATAGVSVGIGIGVPGIYGTYRIRTGPCSRPRFAYNHPYRCGYPRFSEPVFIDGVWVNEPLYYRMYGGQRWFWHGGRWVVGHGSWDGRVFRGDWRRTWHDRGWDRAEMRDRMQDRREDMRDNMRDRMEDRRDDMKDRMQDKREDMRDRMQDRREDMRDRDHDNDNGPNGRDRDNGPNGRDRDNGPNGRDRDNGPNGKDRDNDNGRGH
jgi:hypothetical protein